MCPASWKLSVALDTPSRATHERRARWQPHPADGVVAAIPSSTPTPQAKTRRSNVRLSTKKRFHASAGSGQLNVRQERQCQVGLADWRVQRPEMEALRQETCGWMRSPNVLLAGIGARIDTRMQSKTVRPANTGADYLPRRRLGKPGSDSTHWILIAILSGLTLAGGRGR